MEQLSITSEVSSRKIKILNYLNNFDPKIVFSHEKHYISKSLFGNKILEEEKGEMRLSELTDKFGKIVYKKAKDVLLNLKEDGDNI